MSPLRRRVVFWVPIAVAVIATLVVAFRPQPVAVDMAEVTRGLLAVTVDAEGRTRAREVYVVSAPVAGRLLRLDLDVGDPVAAGRTVVARLRPSEPTLLDRRTRRELEAELKAAEAALALADAALAEAEAELAFAAAERARATRLQARGNISEAALERAVLAFETALAHVASAEAERDVRRFAVETARARLMEPGEASGVDCCVEVPAPVDGVVLALLRESEAVVAAGTPLVELGDARDLEVVVDVLSRDAVRLEAGAPVRFRGWGGDGVLTGTIRRIEPVAFTEVSALGIEEQRVNVVVAIAADDPRWQRLGHGFRLDASLVVWEGEVLRVPITALFRGPDGGWRAYAVRDGRAEAVAVEIGHANAEAAELRAGLDVGDVVVDFPGNRVADGVRVTRRAY